MEHLLLILAAVVFAYGLVSARLSRTIVTAPIIFVAGGVLIATTWGSAIESNAEHLLETVAELTLVILLFTDASRIDLRTLASNPGLPVRLLLIGLPLTILLGAVVAKLFYPGFSLWEAALLSAILAPTDAALGQAVVSSEKVPAKVRQALNVESGLNDGIAVPFVLFFASLAAVQGDAASASHWLIFVGKQILLGPLAGLVVGAFGGRLIEKAAQQGWVTSSFMKLSGVAFAILAWAGASAIGGNGFIAAFVCGMTIGGTTVLVKPYIQEFGETEGQLFSLAAFLLFGATFVLPTLYAATVVDWGYAALSLSLIRMIPVALAMLGTQADKITVVFIGWFGPRGLASLIFTLLVVGQYEFLHAEQLITVAMLTAVLSVFVHGLTSLPGANWYARAVNSHQCSAGCEHEDVTEQPLRIRMRSSRNSASS